jgi:hypothetical protein
LKEELHPLEERNNLLQAHKRTPESIKVSKKDGSPMTEVEVEEEIIKSTTRIEQLNAQLTELATNKAGQLIHAADLNECLIVLGNLNPSLFIIDYFSCAGFKSCEVIIYPPPYTPMPSHYSIHTARSQTKLWPGNYSQQNFLLSRLTFPFLPRYRKETHQEGD